jgi:hypothetical protein
VSSAVDIIAKLRLNAENFSSGVSRVLGDAERRFGSSGSVIGRNISQGIGDGLQSAAARVPVLGGALAGLSGPALIAAGGVGLITAGLAHGVREAEELAKAVRRIDATLAGGNKTGLSRNELIAFSEEIESSFAIAQEEVLGAMATLGTFDGVSEQVFTRAIKLAGGLAATEGDLASNTQKLGIVLQNLATGEVEGLSKGFKRLGTDTLDAIAKLAEVGKTAEAQELLLRSLEKQIGGHGEANAKGITGAIFRLKDEASDLFRTFAERSGLYDQVATGFDSIAESAKRVADEMKEMNRIEATGSFIKWVLTKTGASPAGYVVDRIVDVFSGDAPGPRVPTGRSPAPSRIALPEGWSPNERPPWERRGAFVPPGWTPDARPRWERKGQLVPATPAPSSKTVSDEEQRAQRQADLEAQQAAAALRKATADKKAAEAAKEKRTPKQVYDAFMRELKREGLQPTSGYRTFEEQASLYRRLGRGNAAPPGTSDHEFYGAFDFDHRVDRERLARAARRAEVRLKPELVHGKKRHLHQGFEEARGSAGGGGGEAEMARLEDQRRASAKLLADERERALKAIRDGSDAAAEALHFDLMRLRGLESQADAEEEIARLRRQYADDLAKLPEAERKVTDGLEDQLARYRAQADIMASLMLAHGERRTLTEAEKAAEQEVQRLMEGELARAQALAKTAEDRVRIERDLVRVRHQLNGAADEGADRDRDQQRIDAERRRDREKQQKAWRDFIEEEQQAQREAYRELADFWEDAFRSGGDSVWDSFKDTGYRVLGELAARWTLVILGGQKTGMPGPLAQIGAFAGRGGAAGGLLDFLLGGRGGGLGGGLPGFGGGVFYPGRLATVPEPLRREAVHEGFHAAANKGPGGLAGSVQSAMPYLAAATAVLGIVGLDPIGSIKKALTGAKRGSATLGFDAYGELGVGSTRGNSRSRIDSAKAGVGSVAEALRNIAEQLGGDVSGTPSVSYGIRNKSIRVDTTGKGRTKKGAGVLDFGQDEEAAARAMVSDALKDGLISGIDDVQKKILASGQSLEKALEKALLVGDIDKRMKAMLDPVGAEIDDFNRQWEKTVAALREGGASSERMAEAQKLYKMELEQVKTRTREAAADLKDFLKDLSFGASSPYSLRDQGAMAKAALQPFLDKIELGERIDQGKFIEAARGLLDIERDLYGSTGRYFETLAGIQAATNRAIGDIDRAMPARAPSDPFAEKTASNTLSIAHSNDQINQRLSDHGRILEALLRAIEGKGGGGFIGGASGFVGAGKIEVL